MFDRFFVVLFQVITLFLMMGVGFALGRLKLITEKGTKEMSSILINVSSPCLILTTFQIDWDHHLLVTLGTGTLAMLGCYIIYILISRLFFRKQEEGSRVCLQFGCVYGNVGFMGIPLEQAILGPKGVFYGVVYVVVFNLFIWTWGVARMEKGRGKREEGGSGGTASVGAWKMVANPGTIGIALGLPLFLLSAAEQGKRGSPQMCLGLHRGSVLEM